MGKYTSVDGWFYTGEYKGGERHGNGTYQDIDGQVYKGAFVDVIFFFFQ